MTRTGAVVALLALLLALVVESCGDDSPSSARPPTSVDIGAGLSGPFGLKATVYTTGIKSAAAFAFDARGRLWVATADYTDSGSDGVYLLSAAGAAPVQVISSLHTALGLLWSGNTLFVSSKERVDAYAGFDGTRFAATSPVLSLPPGVGEVNGLALGPDGRLRLGVTSSCDHCTPDSKWSAAVLSFGPDGSDLQVEASNIRAPIGLAYYPGTSDLFITMNQRDDLGDATPGDWLAVVSQGQDWGFPDCYGQGSPACANVPQPVAVLDKHAAVSGVAIVTGQLGAAIGNAAIVAEWQTGRVMRVALTHTGSTYAGQVSTFLTGIANPVAVAISPNGALFVGDWTSGTIYSVTTR
jgi:glucose/arabinose dehydrogenase